MTCPECGELAVNRPPTTLFPYTAHGAARPEWSHTDGEPLCPIVGPDGYHPAQPVPATVPTGSASGWVVAA
ncbi:MAG: hypothetical protein ACQSGP_16120 [Frankia sp.]